MVDRAKLKALVRDLCVWKPAAAAELLNENRGGFIAAIWMSDPTHLPPIVASGKGAFAPIPALSGLVRIANGYFHDIERGPAEINPKTGASERVHSDGVWISTMALAKALTVLVEDVLCENLDGLGFHFDGGSGRLVYRRCEVYDTTEGDRINVKLLPGCELELVLDGCHANLTIDTSKLGGAPAGSVLKHLWVRNHQGSLPTYLPGVVLHPEAVPQDLELAPPVDPCAARIAAMQGTIDQLKGANDALRMQVTSLTLDNTGLAQAAQTSADQTKKSLEALDSLKAALRQLSQ